MLSSLIFLIILILFPAGSIHGQSLPRQDEVLQEQLKVMDLQAIEQEMQHLSPDLEKFLQPRSLTQLIMDIAGGKLPLEPGKFLKSLLETFFWEVAASSHLLGRIMVLAVFSSLLQLLVGSFGRAEVGKLARSVTYLLLILLILGALQSVMLMARDTISSMTDFMTALIPVLISVLVGMGAVTSAALFQPLVFLGITLAGTLVQTVILPLLFFAAILGLVNGTGKEFRIERLINFIREISLSILGLTLVLFVGLMALQGAAGAVGDGLTLRTAKYLTGTFIPVIGGMFSDAVELVAGCSLLIKNALGLIGLLMVLIMTLYPVVKMLALVFIFKLAAALIQPLGDEELADTMNEAGKTVLHFFLVVLSVTLMFFICLTVIVGIANMVVMLR